MRCSYCDTAYAFNVGNNFTIDQILENIAKYKTKNVTVTGGEPLAQRECWNLLKILCDKGYIVSLETGGAISISKVDERVKVILDIKTPKSGEDKNNDWENLKLIKITDIDSKDLAEWILKDFLPVRFQIQLHKVIWGEIQGV